MHGPGPRTETNALGWEPLWLPPHIPVLDSVALSLPERRPSWRAARTKALAKWEAAGFVFSVSEDAGQEFTGNPPWIGPIGYWDLLPLLMPGVIRLMPTGAGDPSFGWYMDLWVGGGPQPSGAACYTWSTLQGEWLKKYKRPELAGLIAHEVGHVLGLWHRDKAIMGGGLKPDDHDIESLQEFYSPTISP